MTTRRMLTAAVLAVVTLVVTIGATATTAWGAGPPQAQLWLALTPEAAGSIGVARLTCHPAGGDHPKAAAACLELGRAGGDPDRLDGSPVACTLEFAPVTATAVGQWRGRPISWTRTYSNRCVARAATGSVFEI